MKKKILICIVMLCLSLVCFVGVSLSKYVFNVTNTANINSKNFYFESDASDITVPISNPNFSIDVENYLGTNYTNENISYKISISDGNGISNNYNFSINGGNISNDDYYVRSLTGGVQTTDTLNIAFNKMVTNNLVEEELYFTIEALEPYTKTITFTVTVINPPGFDVTGNPTSWTNQDVTLTVVPTNPSTVAEYSFDDGATWQTSPSKVYSANENDIRIKIKDIYGTETQSVSVDITKIDKDAPTITFNSSPLIVTLNESNLYTSLINADDALSGLDVDGLVVKRGRNTVTNTNSFTYPGLYAISVSATDNAGNNNSFDTTVLVRWPTAGKYVVAKTRLDGAGIQGTGLSSTTSPDGLYKDDAQTGANAGYPFASKYYYTGPTVDNYISFGGTTFRILNVSTNDDIKVLGEISDVKTAWGSRKIYESNTYNTWSTKWWPRGQIYNNETGESRYKLFTETEKAHLDLATFYAGRFNKADAVDIAYTVYYEQTGGINLGGDNNPAFEGYSAYPNVSDYLKASKAHDVVKSIDDTQDNGVLGIGQNKRTIFKANSWIDMTADQWTMNSKNLTNTDNDFWVLDTAAGPNIQSRTYYYNQQYRVVFYLKADTILSGSGTLSDPYTVEEDWSWFDDVQVLQ